MKGIVLSVRNGKTAHAKLSLCDLRRGFKRYGAYAFFFLISAVSVFAGAFLSKYDGISEGIGYFFGTDVLTRSDVGFTEIFAVYLSSSFFLMLTVLILGFCALSAPFLPVFVSFKAVSIGNFAASLCKTYGAKGILYYFLNCFLCDTIVLVLLCIECRHSLSLSVDMFKSVILGRFEAGSLRDNAKDFAFKCSNILALTAVASAVCAALHFVLSGAVSL